MENMEKQTDLLCVSPGVITCSYLKKWVCGTCHIQFLLHTSVPTVLSQGFLAPSLLQKLGKSNAYTLSLAAIRENINMESLLWET